MVILAHKLLSKMYEVSKLNGYFKVVSCMTMLNLACVFPDRIRDRIFGTAVALVQIRTTQLFDALTAPFPHHHQ